MRKINFGNLAPIEYFCLGASALYCIIFIVFSFYWLSSPYPNEYRELANVDITRIFLQGENPYDIENISPFFYVYGFFMPLLTSWLYSFINFLPIDLLLFQRFIALVATILCGWISAKEVKSSTNSSVYAFLAFSMVLIVGWSMGLCVAFPNTLGVFFMLLTLYRAKRIKSVGQILIVSVLTVLTFFVKQYFVIVFFLVLVWLLFRSKKHALYYTLFSFLCFTCAAVIVNYVYPTFFSIAIVHHLAVASYSISFLIKQLLVTGLFYFPLIILFILIVYSYKNKFGKMEISFNLSRTWDLPLIQMPVSPDIYAVATCLNFLAILRLGMHAGAYMTYFYQLLIPVLTIYTLSHIDILKKGRTKNIFLLLTVVFSLYHIGFFVNIPKSINEREISEWENFYKILDADKTKGLYIYSPLLAKYAWDHQLPVWNNGHTEYISTLKSHGIIEHIFPEANKIVLKNEKQLNRLYQQITTLELPVIITDNLSFLKPSFLKQVGYYATDSVSLKAGTTPNYTVYRWIPCSEKN